MTTGARRCIGSFRRRGRVTVPHVRRSVAFFHDGNFDGLIECLPTCVSADRPARYEPVLAGDHLLAKLMGPRTMTASTAAFAPRWRRPHRLEPGTIGRRRLARKDPMVSAAPLRALLLEDIHPDAAALLRAAGYDVEQLTRALEGDELKQRLQGIDAAGHPFQDDRHR